MKKIRTKLLLILLVIAALGIYYYAALPPVNIHSTDFWVFLFVLGILAALIFIKKKNLNRYELKESKGLKVILGVVALIVIVYLVGALLSSRDRISRGGSFVIADHKCEEVPAADDCGNKGVYNGYRRAVL